MFFVLICLPFLYQVLFLFLAKGFAWLGVVLVKKNMPRENISLPATTATAVPTGGTNNHTLSLHPPVLRWFEMCLADPEVGTIDA